MPGVDFEKDFPQPPAGAVDRSAATTRRIGFAHPEQHRIELPLEFPLDVEGERLERLTIHRLTAGDMLSLVEGEGAPADDQTLIRHVVAAMAGIDLDILDALAPDDAGRLAAAALPFMPAGLVGALQGQLRAAGLAEPGTA